MGAEHSQDGQGQDKQLRVSDNYTPFFLHTNWIVSLLSNRMLHQLCVNLKHNGGQVQGRLVCTFVFLFFIVG